MLSRILFILFIMNILSHTLFAEDSNNDPDPRHERERDLERARDSRRENHKRFHNSHNEDMLDMEMEDHMDRYRRSDRHRDRHGHRSEHSKRDIGAVRYSVLEKKLNQNLDKFTEDEIATIRKEMNDYLEKENSIGDFHESLQADRDMLRKIDNKEKRLAKLEEIKVKHKAMGVAHKEQRNAARDMFHAVQQKIDAKLSTEL